MTEKINVARLIFIGKTLLGYTEREVWHMTLRKLSLLYAEYRSSHGQVQQEPTLDDIFPEGGF